MEMRRTLALRYVSTDAGRQPKGIVPRTATPASSGATPFTVRAARATPHRTAGPARGTSRYTPRPGGRHERESAPMAEGIGSRARGKRLPFPRGPGGRGPAVVAAGAARGRGEGGHECYAAAYSAAGGGGAAGAGEGGSPAPRLEPRGREALPG